MKTLIIFLCLVGVGYGQQISTKNLSDAQRAQLMLQVAEMEKAPDIDAMKEYAEMGQSIAVAVSACAKELGVAVDDFSRTSVGKITLALVVWHVMGRDVIHIGLGSFLLVGGVSLWVYFFKRICLYESIDYVNGKKSKVNYQHRPSEEQRLLFLVVLVMLMTASIVIILT